MLDINLEFTYDELTVYDGGTGSAGQLWSSYSPAVIYTSSNQVFITFSTDSSVVFRGFFITLRQLTGEFFYTTYLAMPISSYDISRASDWSRRPSRPIRSLRYIVR